MFFAMQSTRGRDETNRVGLRDGGKDGWMDQCCYSAGEWRRDERWWNLQWTI